MDFRTDSCSDPWIRVLDVEAALASATQITGRRSDAAGTAGAKVAREHFNDCG
jgi:hypothetical protein